MGRSARRLSGILALVGALCSEDSRACGGAWEPGATERRHALYSSLDGGRMWSPVPGNLPADLQVAFVEPLRKQLVIATEGHGLFIGDATGHWESIGAGLPSRRITALHVADPVLYAAASATGVFASADRGRTWRSLSGNLPDLRVRAIMTVDGALLVATDTGIFRRRPNVSRWESVFAEGQFVSLSRNGRRIVAGGARGAALSTDGGGRWRWIRQTGAAHNTAILGSRIVVMNVSGDLDLSDDWGRTWRSAGYGPREGSYVYDVTSLGAALVASNNYGIHRSENGGARWTLVHPTEERVYFDLVALDGVLYAGTREWGERRAKSSGTNPQTR